MRRSSQAIRRALERLSSGKRLNSPSDGASDYALSLRLDSQIKGLSQINLGLNQATGLLQTATSAISTQIEIVQQMREIAIQGQSSFLSGSERDGLNQELYALRDEFTRIANQTTFAGVNLFNEPSGDISFLLDENTSLDIERLSLDLNELLTKSAGNGNFDLTEMNLNGTEESEFNSYDLNGDGFDDVVHFDPNDQVFRTYLSDGEGGFNVNASFDTSGLFDSVGLGDIDGDGDVDLIGGNDGSDSINIYLNDGSGNLSLSSSYALGDGLADVDRIQLGDIDHDGDVDLVARDASSIFTMLNDGSGSFSSGSSFTPVGSTPFVEGLLDVNNDGLLDVVAVAAKEVSTYLGDGNGNFSFAQSSAVDALSESARFEDFNGDGNLDFAVASDGNGANVFLGDGTGGFNFGVGLLGSADVRSIDVADYNNDGIADIVAANYDFGSIDILVGNGAGGFELVAQVAVRAPASSLYDVVAGDFNGDGVDDFFFGSDDAYLISGAKEVSALSDLNVDSTESASKILDILDSTIQGLEGIQADFSADLVRAEIALNANLLLSEDLSDAKFNLESADFALETANLVSAQILQQAQVAVLTQANTNLQVVLQLLD